MALSSLRYRPEQHHGPSETKSGSYIYDGSIGQFHEWEFRTSLRVAAAKADIASASAKGKEKGETETGTNFAFTASRIIEGLRSDALDIAMDIGIEKLTTPEGIEDLIAAIRTSLFPVEAQEAKILFQSGQRPGGPLSRQSGESMISYIGRRKRWWQMCKKLDKGMVLSDDMLGSMLLDHAGLSGMPHGDDIHTEQHII